MQYIHYGTPILFLCQANIEFFLASAPLLLTYPPCWLAAGLHDELSQIQLDSSSYSNEFPKEPKKITLTQHYGMLIEVIFAKHPVTFYSYSNDEIYQSCHVNFPISGCPSPSKSHDSKISP